MRRMKKAVEESVGSNSDKVADDNQNLRLWTFCATRFMYSVKSVGKVGQNCPEGTAYYS